MFPVYSFVLSLKFPRFYTLVPAAMTFSGTVLALVALAKVARLQIYSPRTGLVALTTGAAVGWEEGTPT